MAKPIVVVFNRTNARVHKGEIPEGDHSGYVLINPNMSEVRGIKPQYWVAEANSNRVVPMNEAQKLIRDKDIQLYGVDNDITHVIKTSPKAEKALKPVYIDKIVEKEIVKTETVYEPVYIDREVIKEVPTVITQTVEVEKTLDPIYIDRIITKEVPKYGRLRLFTAVALVLGVLIGYVLGGL